VRTRWSANNVLRAPRTTMRIIIVSSLAAQSRASPRALTVVVRAVNGRCAMRRQGENAANKATEYPNLLARARGNLRFG
jgi:hypothetical protein